MPVKVTIDKDNAVATVTVTCEIGEQLMALDQALESGQRESEAKKRFTASVIDQAFNCMSEASAAAMKTEQHDKEIVELKKRQEQEKAAATGLVADVDDVVSSARESAEARIAEAKAAKEAEDAARAKAAREAEAARAEALKGK